MLPDIYLSLVLIRNYKEVQRLLKKLVNANRKSLLLLLWMCVVPLLASSLLTFFAFTIESRFENASGFDLAMLYTLSSLTMALAITPTTFIALISGFFIGLESIPWLIVSYQVASYWGFLLAKRIDQGRFLETTEFYPKAKSILLRLNEHPFFLVLLARISPILPFAIMNVILSLSGIKLKHFLWGGLWGMLPRTLLFVTVGSQASLLIELLESPNQNRIIMAGTVILLLVSLVGLYIYFVGLMRKSSPTAS